MLSCWLLALTAGCCLSYNHPNPQDLWRLKINKGGRILFEVAIEYNGATVHSVQPRDITPTHVLIELAKSAMAACFT